MSTAPRPNLHIKAHSLGPVFKLDADLSRLAQNLIYARNGTGKSFLTRALRYLDLHGQGLDISSAAGDLIAEESSDGKGSFTLSQGNVLLGALSLATAGPQNSASVPDRIFHVFADEFVHSELRQKEYVVDGNIESKITLDQTLISTSDAEAKLDAARAALEAAHNKLKEDLAKSKIEELVTKAGINKRLTEYQQIDAEPLLLAYATQPAAPDRSFKQILADLDSLKSLPAEPDYPDDVINSPLQQNDLDAINELLEKITSPSTVSEEIRTKISEHPEFYEAGVGILTSVGHESCPFCEQSVMHPPAKDQIQAYLTYFADAEGRHKKELRHTWSQVKLYRTAISTCASSLTRQITKYESLKRLVPSQKDAVLPDALSTLDAIEKRLMEYALLIELKGKSPSMGVSLPEQDLFALYINLNLELAETNRLFAGLRKAIDAADSERKALPRNACSVFEIEFVRSQWPAFEIIQSCEKNFSDASSELSNLKKSQLSASVKERVAATFDELVRHFFGSKYSFDKTTFTLRRENRDMTRGPSRTLSDGEKTAIAFCYFISCIHKKVKSTSDYARLYLVFDDPITSMSYDFIFTIAQTLKNLSVSSVGDISIDPSKIDKGHLRPDLLVFTHSSYFYNICVTNRVIKEEAAFFLHKAGSDHKLSKLAKYIAPFEQHLRQILDVHNGADPDHTTGNAIRCVLEAVGRFCHPDKCESLTTYVTYLAGDGGFQIKSVMINNMSHGTYYDHTPSPDEIREACSETILIVEKYAKGQLEVARSLSAQNQKTSAAVA